MNRWRCDVHGCESTAVGVGGAIGLRAIGWYFRRGPVTLCPEHRPDPTTNRVEMHNPAGNTGQPCSLCAAEIEALEHQVRMGADAWTEVRHVD